MAKINFDSRDVWLDDFIKHPTAQKARVLWLAYVEAGESVPPIVLERVIADVRKQVEGYKLDHPNENKDENELLMLKIHYEITKGDRKVSQQKIFEYFAEMYEIISKGDGSEPWEVLKSRYRRYLEKLKS